MKKIKLSILCLLTASLLTNANAQLTQSHQSQSPPVNPFHSFTRGMYIDCTDDILNDITSGNSLGLKQNLFDYIQNNYTGYIILTGLEYSNVFGNPTLESALRNLLIDTRTQFPGIQIGIAGSASAFFQTTSFLHVWDKFGRDCYPIGSAKTKKELETFVNDQSSVALQKRSEICKFFIRAARLGNEKSKSQNHLPCKGNFDALYLQYRFWDQTSSLLAMQSEFEQYKEILTVMKALKCSYNCIDHIDTEFLPTDFFKLQGWTAIDQITDIDPLADRLMVPAFTRNAQGVFDVSCKTLHYLSDRFSKPRSEIFLELSAESPAFNYCNSSLTPGNFLGDYLNGTVSPSGNMYSVEQMWLNKINDPLYVCPACNCSTFQDNHYQSTNLPGNVIVGTIWGPYSMLQSNQLYKKKNESTLVPEKATPILIQYYDLLGHLIMQSTSEALMNQINTAGIYIKRMLFSDGREQSAKIIIHAED